MWLSFGEWLLNRRWAIVLVASLSVFIFEWLEYRPFLEGVNASFFAEITFYGVALPLSTGIALSWVASTRTELSWLNYYQNLKNNLVIQLSNAHSRHELAAVLLGFFQVTMPLAGATVYAYEERSHKYKSILNWFLKEGSNSPASIFDYMKADCVCLNQSEVTVPLVLQPCRDPKVVAASSNMLCFCIPFLFSNSPVGSARLYFAHGNAPSPEQRRLLKEITPKIAAEFHRVQLELMIKRRKYSLNAEQQRIARDVHDTLGHSLAFLRLRLDHISMEFEQPGMDKVRQEVEALRDVAKEAYDQMRDVLTQLNSESDSGLNETLISYADKISQRTSFEVDIQHDGQQRDLPPLVHRNIVYIFREILTNVEKHAQAQHVGVKLKWYDAHLEVEVNDDGVGFDPARRIANDHFGVKNMQDRANEIQARLSISSSPNRGTHHTLRVPYEVTYEADHRRRSLSLSQWSGKSL
jgi:signal transduction histidine kinase